MKAVLLSILLICCIYVTAQPVPVFKDAVSVNRNSLYHHIVQNTINKNLATILSDSTEDRWEDAFYALELIQLKDSSLKARIDLAVRDIENRSFYFQRSLLELLYGNYPDIYTKQLRSLFDRTADAKIFAMTGEYLLHAAHSNAQRKDLLLRAKQRAVIWVNNPLAEQLLFNISTAGKKTTVPSIHTFLKKEYLPGNVLMISFQRKNRNFPGLVMVRDAHGDFVKDSSGYFHVPQLARSISNLPGYLTNGNTPEGILRMDGFDISRGSMIGPTTNVQLTLPFEYNTFHFYRDSTLTDTVGNIQLYKKLLPPNFRNYYPAQQAYYAGKAGRSEIIAHGTTIDPAYYSGMSFYPMTPTVGCLCTKEIWSTVNGNRLQSDQQLLINAVTAAGGPYGYAIVINIDDRQEAVTIKDILPFLKRAGQK